MGLLYIATVKTKKGTAKLDRMGNVSVPGRMTVIKPESIVSVDLEDGEALSSRITATRLMALGVFALGVKKKTGGEKYLTIMTDDDCVVLEVDRKHIGEAVRFKNQLSRFVGR